MTTLLLTRSDVESLAEMSEVVSAVESAFGAHGRGAVQMPSKVYIDLPEFEGDFRAMPAYMDSKVGVKWVNSHPNNPQRHGLPAVMGMYILSDPATATPLAVMDATLLTALRTGAAGAVASKYLAVGAPRSIGFVGSGVQARVLLSAHLAIFPKLAVRAADLEMSRAETFARDVGGRAVSVEQACACDIVCTTTPSRSPVVQAAWIGGGTHINAIGADGPGKQELDPGLLATAKVVIDEREQALHSGEINVPIHDGSFDPARLHGTLGDVVIGNVSGREGDEISIFDSTGLAIQDVAVAARLHALARERGIGTEIDFLS